MGSCEHGNEPLGSIKDMEFCDKLSVYQLVKNDSAPCSFANWPGFELWP
jgi:hypothetical protein